MKGKKIKSTRFILSFKALGHSQERIEEITHDFLDGVRLSTKAISRGDEILVKGITVGKTTGGAGDVPKKQENELPGVTNINGWKFEKGAKYAPGKKLQLFPTQQQRNSPSKKPNLGWIDDETQTFGSPEELVDSLLNEPKVEKKIYNIDKDGNPTSVFWEEGKNEIEEKSLGRSLREMNPRGGLAQQAARRLRIVVDDLGKFRCPPGTPQANQFTDKLGTTCFAVSVDELAGLVQGAMQKFQMTPSGPKFGNVLEPLASRGQGTGRIRESRRLAEGASRWFSGAVKRVSTRHKKIDANIKNLEDTLGVSSTPLERATNADLTKIFRELRKNGHWDVEYDGGISDRVLKPLLDRAGLSLDDYRKSERAFLSRLLMEYSENPELATKVGRIVHYGIGTKQRKSSNEAHTEPISYRVRAEEVKFEIMLDVGKMTRASTNFEGPVVSSKKHRWGLTVTGGSTEEQRQAALLDYVNGQNDFSNHAADFVMFASEDKHIGKGSNTASHELNHVRQAMAVLQKIKEDDNLRSKKLSDMSSNDLWNVLIDINDDVDMKDFDKVMKNKGLVDVLGGGYPRSFKKDDDVGMLELLAEVGALNDSGVISGQEIDDFLDIHYSWQRKGSAVKRDVAKRKAVQATKKRVHQPSRNSEGVLDVPVFPESDGATRRQPPRKSGKTFFDSEGTQKYAKEHREWVLSKLTGSEQKAIERLGRPEHEDRDIVKITRLSSIEDSIKRMERRNRELVDVGLEPDGLSVHEASVSQQLERTLIPTLTALDKTELPDRIQIAIPSGAKWDQYGNAGATLMPESISSHNIVDNEMAIEPGMVIVDTSPGTRGIFYAEKNGGSVILPPSKIRTTYLDGDNVWHAEIVDQESSMDTINRLEGLLPTKANDKRDEKLIAREVDSIRQVIDTHRSNAAASNSGILGDGLSHPIAAKRTRKKNSDLVDSILASGGKPFDDSPKQIGSDLPDWLKKQLFGTSEFQEYIDGYSDEDVFNALDNAALDLHEGFDRRVRVRMGDEGLNSLLSGNAVSAPKLTGSRAMMQKRFLASNGITENAKPDTHPVSGYVAHGVHEEKASELLRMQGIVTGDAPIEFDSSNHPYGSVGADGDIEVLLRPEVSGRTAYSLGRGIDHSKKPVWMNSDNTLAISEALLPMAENRKDNTAGISNALTAHLDNDLSAMNNMKVVKPNAKKPSYREEMADANFSGGQPYGAHILGGFDRDDIAEIRHPWSKIEKSSTDVDISDVAQKEPISEKLTRLGYSEEEINYFYSLNGRNGTSGINTSAMKQLRSYRKSQTVKSDYEKMGVPSVSFPQKHGLDMHSPSSYSTNPTDRGKTIETVLSKRIEQEIDAELEAAMKKIQKARAELAGVSS